MGVDWNGDANLDVPKLLKSWRMAHRKYAEQIAEATERGTACEQMKGCEAQLWECIHNLERATGIPKSDEYKKQANTMKCEICNHDPATGDGHAIHRVNPLGELPARWRCFGCMTPEQKSTLDTECKAITDIIESVKQTPPANPQCWCGMEKSDCDKHCSICGKETCDCHEASN